MKTTKTSEQIRKAFLDFWSENPRNSKVIPNSSLVPMNVQGGNTLLFVNSGMFPIIPFLTGQPHPLGTRVHNVQRCIRTKDIEDVGDNRHLVMFEMIGNWSFGDFTKKEQIGWCLELYIKKFGLDPKRLYVTVWAGDEVVERDTDAIELWKTEFKKYGVDAEFSENIEDIPANLTAGQSHKARIFPYGRDANWWEVSHSAGEPGGPSSEIFYDLGEKEREQDKYHINDDSGRFIEIGNNVFMEYKLDENLKYHPLERKNIDFGGGFDRIMMAAQNKFDVYSTDLFTDTIQKTEELTGKKYPSSARLRRTSSLGGDELAHHSLGVDEDTKSFRVIAEHIRSSVFILADGIKPSSKDQGYILRRLIRRMIRYGLKLGITNNFSKDLAQVVINKMSGSYPHLESNKQMISEEIEKEEIKFRRTLVQGLKEFKNIILGSDSLDLEKANNWESKADIEHSAEKFFYIYETYGFPLELSIEEFDDIFQHFKKRKLTAEEILAITIEFKNIETKHKDASRAGSEQKFKGGLADNSQETTKLHTAHHLLLAALQKVVSPDIKQRGSNITQERLRIDFNLDRKLTEEETKKVEDLVNDWINKKLAVLFFEMNKEDAEKLGAQMEFGAKYPDKVTLFFIVNELTTEDRVKVRANIDESTYNLFKGGTYTLDYKEAEILKKYAISIEFCGGPHVANTSELGEGNKKFKILKEESSGAGIRRIKAALI